MNRPKSIGITRDYRKPVKAFCSIEIGIDLSEARINVTKCQYEKKRKY
jgi:hypothetical protein